jgi:hypothetical protein
MSDAWFITRKQESRHDAQLDGVSAASADIPQPWPHPTRSERIAALGMTPT